MIKDPYRSFIATSRYSRWLDGEGRRETWAETVTRTTDFFGNHMDKNFANALPKAFWKEANTAIANHEVMPSMRVLMTAGKALERENVAGYNPVTGDTEVLVRGRGMTPIAKLIDSDEQVLNVEGRWADASFRSYGVQPTFTVSARKNRTQQRQNINATANHRWVLEDGTVVPTSSLKIGDRLAYATAPRPDTNNIDYKLGLIHGLIYGDGTSTYTQERLKGYHIRLCGSSRELLGLFENHGKVCYPPSANGDPVVMLYGSFAKTHNLKSLPDPSETEEYLLGFIRGWLAADGSVSVKGAATLCANQEGVDWFNANAGLVGMLSTGCYELNPTTNFGGRKARTFSMRLDNYSMIAEDFIILSKRDRFVSREFDRCYVVDSVSATGMEEEVFCAEVPDTNTFVLASGLVTGNCSFIAVDDARAFDEALYILMNGVGLGFSVEAQYTNQLPTVNEHFEHTNTTIVVADSKAGWARALRELIAMLYAGQIPAIDTSSVRPAGARLKTFGGRASGPQPLVELFEYTIAKFKHASGRKLTPVECHGIMCKIAEVVVVGGVRRCFTDNTELHTERGTVLGRDILVGDTIVSGGRKARVSAKVDSGNQMTVIVKHQYGQSEMTPNHRIAVFDGIYSYSFKEAGDLEPGDRLVWDLYGYDGEIQALPETKYFGHFNAKSCTVPATLDTDAAWLIGLVHGDGHVHAKGIEISSSDSEWETLERANAIFADQFGVTGAVTRDSHGGKGIRLRINSTGLASWFAENIKRPHEPIRVPSFVTNAQRDVRAAYLAGVLDSDGRIRNDGVIEQMTTVYPDFARDVCGLLRSLGIATTNTFTSARRRRDNGERAKDYWTVKIAGNTSRCMWFDIVGPLAEKALGIEVSERLSPYDFTYPAEWGLAYRNRATLRTTLVNRGDLTKDYPFAPVAVESVEPGTIQQTWDIEVEGIHEFTADGLVTHNSALISQSDLNDYEMAHAKMGAWWTENQEYALANNSAVFYKEPSTGELLKFWADLYESKSGERGIINMEGLRNRTDAPRRDLSHVQGLNPSLVPGTLVYTTGGIVPIEELEGSEFTVRDLNGNLAPAKCWKSGVDKKVYKVSLRGGHSYEATKEHKWPVLRGGKWQRVQTTDIVPGDKLKNTLHDSLFPNGTEGTYDEGFLIGWNLGDGWQTTRDSGLQIGFIVSDEDRESGIDSKLMKQLSLVGSQADLTNKSEINVNNTGLRELFIKYGVKHKTEGLPLAVWDSGVSDDFRRGLVDALFSSDGFVSLGDARLGIGQASKVMIDELSALLGFFGVKTTHSTHRTTGRKSFAGHPAYLVDDKDFVSHYIRICGIENIKHFAKNFRLSRCDKQEKLTALEQRQRKSGIPSNEYIEVVSVEESGVSDVWDVSVYADNHAFRLSHAVTGNCFTADTYLMTESGWTTFGDAYKSGESQKIIQDGRITFVESEPGVESPRDWKISKKGARGVITEASEVFLTQTETPVMKMVTSNGQCIRLTPDHLVATPGGMVRADELSAGSRVLVTAAPLPTDELGAPLNASEIEGLLMGLIAGDGTFSAGKVTERVHIDLWGDDREISSDIKSFIDTLWSHYGESIISAGNRPFTKYTVVVDDSRNKIRISSSFLAALLNAKYGFSRQTKHSVPKHLIENARSRSARFYVAGLAFADGTINKYNKVGSSSIRISQSDYNMLSDVNKILLANGIVAPLYERRQASSRLMPDGHGGLSEYDTKANYELVVMQHKYEYAKYIGFFAGRKQELANGMFKFVSSKKNTFAKVVSIESDGREDVYCLKEKTNRTLTAGGVAMRRCGEILLRSKQFCVAGDTPIITSSGIHNIADIEGQKVEVWNGEAWSEVTVRNTRVDSEMIRVRFGDGSYLDCTPDHRFSVKNRFDSSWREVQAQHLMDDKYVMSVEPTVIFPKGGITINHAYTLGFAVGDGHISNDKVYIDLYGDEKQDCPVEGLRQKPYTPKGYSVSKVRTKTPIDVQMMSRIRNGGFREIAEWDRTSALEFFAGLADADGSQANGGVRIYISGESNARDAQLVLTKNGVRSSVNLCQRSRAETNKGTRLRDLWYLQITDARELPTHRLDASRGAPAKFKGKYQSVKSIEVLPNGDAYCFTEYQRHMAVFANVLTYQCNLTEVIVRPEDALEDLKRKIRIASTLGTVQSSLTDFKYLRKVWKDNCNEERLLGVSLTGQMDHPVLNGRGGSEELEKWLKAMKQEAINTNAEVADSMGIPRSTAITTGKPSGTVSQLTDSASGGHKRYRKFYVRTVRGDNKDPITRMMKDIGIPNEPDVTKPDTTTVFSFYIKSPDTALTQEDSTAIEDLNVWLAYKKFWTEHNPSVTINVREHEWIEVVNWVKQNWEWVGGISFLPYSDHTYRQAPYQEISEADYYLGIADFPSEIDWTMLSAYELEDNTTGSQTLSCTGSSCEVVDLTPEK